MTECVFIGSYCIERKLVFGKPLIRLAKSLQTNEGVVLKFYDKPEQYVKALSSYKHLNKSSYICKCVFVSMQERFRVVCDAIRPIEKIKAHGGLPDCLAFERAALTLDEWVRVPDIDFGSKRDALKLVRFTPFRLR